MPLHLLYLPRARGFGMRGRQCEGAAAAAQLISQRVSKSRRLFYHLFSLSKRGHDGTTPSSVSFQRSWKRYSWCAPSIWNSVGVACAVAAYAQFTAPIPAPATAKRLQFAGL